MKNNPFSFFLDQLEQKLPDVLRPMPTEIRQAVCAVMDERLAKFGWVPRCEFEAQERLLAQAEARIAALEAQLNQQTCGVAHS